MLANKISVSVAANSQAKAVITIFAVIRVPCTKSVGNRNDLHCQLRNCETKQLKEITKNHKQAQLLMGRFENMSSDMLNIVLKSFNSESLFCKSKLT